MAKISYIRNINNFITIFLNNIEKMLENAHKSEIIFILPTRVSCNYLKNKLDSKKLFFLKIYSIDEIDWIHNFVPKNISDKNIITFSEAILILTGFLEEHNLDILSSSRLAVRLIEQYEFFIKYTGDFNLAENNNFFVNIFKNEFLPYLREKKLLLQSEYNMEIINKFCANDINANIYLLGILPENEICNKIMQKIYEMPNSNIIFENFQENALEVFRHNDFNHSQYLHGKFLSQNKLNISDIGSYDNLNNEYKEVTEAKILVFEDEYNESKYIANFVSNFDINSKIALIAGSENFAKKINLYLKISDRNLNNYNLKYVIQNNYFLYFKLLIRILSENYIVTEFLYFLKNPYTKLELNDKDLIYKFELEVFRRNCHTKGKDEIFSNLESIENKHFFKNISDKFDKFAYYFKDDKKFLLKDLINAHLAMIREMTNENLWEDIEFIQLIKIFEELEKSPASIFLVNNHQYIELIEILISRLAPINTQDVGINLLNLKDIRFSCFEHIIICNLNEGNIPSEFSDNIFMLNSLIAQEANKLIIAIESYIFHTNILSNTITLTRANFEGNKQTTACRWLENNLINSVEKKEFEQVSEENKEIIASAKPPYYARPVKFSPTSFKYLLDDPYGYYAKYILKLAPIQDLCSQVSRRDWGVIIHEIIQKAGIFKIHSIDEFEKMAFNIFSKYKMNATHRFWWYKFLKIMPDLYDFLNQNGEKYFEIFGEIKININNKDYFLNAKADYMISHFNDISIFDFKTGVIPNENDVISGISPQLGMIGLIYENGGFNLPFNLYLKMLGFIKISARHGLEVIEMRENPKIITENFLKNFKGIMLFYENLDNEYIEAKNFPPKYDDYVHLKRRYVI